ncbi:hypothetical protein N7462_000359 [Penicillium macrosclerotiorum]|uniref:uncharacterized protein n=1 Tax=Penicillium macrosclerotiorum TaxID=303699 RepID=UPI0025468F16|nr:uncharacterized protein N7462_000359 [Penicillium macrosclerotiorum]KAJ5698354.1 hypothetical protein N7462_000359 [Penicillium macrosclerotiorum]
METSEMIFILDLTLLHLQPISVRRVSTSWYCSGTFLIYTHATSVMSSHNRREFHICLDSSPYLLLARNDRRTVPGISNNGMPGEIRYFAEVINS